MPRSHHCQGTCQSLPPGQPYIPWQHMTVAAAQLLLEPPPHSSVRTLSSYVRTNATYTRESGTLVKSDMILTPRHHHDEFWRGLASEASTATIVLMCHRAVARPINPSTARVVAKSVVKSNTPHFSQLILQLNHDDINNNEKKFSIRGTASCRSANGHHWSPLPAIRCIFVRRQCR